MELAEFLTHFEGVKRSGAGYKALCPAHSDKKASLCISQGEKGIVMKCQCGCNNNDILKEVCLDMTDLFPDKQQRNEKFYNEKTAREFLKTLPDVTDVYDYKDEKGNLKYFKLRKKDKVFSFVRYMDGKIFWGLSEGRYYETYDGSNSYSLTKRDTKHIDLPETEKTLYNLPNLKNKLAYGDTVYIVEGEKDANTMTKLGLVATTAPTGGGSGDNKWSKEFNEFFKGADVVILPDNDQPGTEFAKLVEKNLLTVAFKIRTVVVCNKEKGDVTDWYEDLADKMQARELLLEMVNDEEKVKVKTPKWVIKDKKDNYKINKNLLAKHLIETLHLEYVGAGQTTLKPIPHYYRNGVYEPCRDILGEIKKYINPTLDPSPEMLKSIEALIKMEKRVITANKLDGDIHIINFKNGLYDIRTGKLSPHTPEYKCVFQIDHDYVEAPINHGYLDSYIKDLSSGKEENARILQEFAGVIISNIPGHYLKTALFLYGAGNTGKGKFFEICGRILGERMFAVATLQELTNKNSPFATSILYCRRLIFSGDLDTAALKSVDILKCLTGGDRLAINFKFGDQFSYLFNGIYAAAMNKLPAICEDFGSHVFQRFTILPCNNVIPEEKRKKNLVEDIVKYDGDYFIQWAIEGAKRVIANNFNFSYCQDVEDVRKQYELITDSVTAFVNHYCVFTDNKKDSIAWKEFREDYQTWCIEEGRDPVRRKNEIEDRLKKIGIVLKPLRGYDVLRAIKGGVRQRNHQDMLNEEEERKKQEESEQEKEQEKQEEKQQEETLLEKECTYEIEKPQEEYEQDVMFKSKYSCDIKESNFPDEIPF